MKTMQSTLLALLLVVGAIAPGCTASEPDDGTMVGSSQARLITSIEGDGASSIHLSATSDDTAELVLDRTLDVAAGASAALDVPLAPGSYTFALDVLGGASGESHLGSGVAHAVVEAGVTTEIRFAARIDAAMGGSAEGSVETSANVGVAVNTAPRIDGVEVATAADGSETVVVHASDADGDALGFLWSGPGIDGSVTGAASFTFDAPALAAAAAAAAGGAGAATVRVVVLDVHGAAAIADAVLTAGADASASVEGSASAGASAGAEGSASADATACLDAHSECTAACDVSIGLGSAVVTDAACIAECNLALAACATL